MQIRNVAIIAHVDHGKTTLVDQLLYQSGMFRTEQLDKLAGGQHNLIMDSNPLERERGITILSKNCAVTYTTPSGEQVRINIVDTPGHADFGGEVERVMRLADGVLVLVDAAEGPLPQTKYVLSKAIAAGLKPIVVINKCDRQDQRADEVHGEMFDLLVELGADDIALDFPTLYASGRSGWATRDLSNPGDDLRPIFDAILEYVPPAGGDANAPLQMLVTTLDYSEYVGRIGIGRVFAGTIKSGQPIAVLARDGSRSNARVVKLESFSGLGREEASRSARGRPCAVIGVEDIDIGDTLADPNNAVALPPVRIDEPTLKMIFRVNDGPFVGREGKYVTSRQIRDRLMKELEHNVALRVEFGDAGDEFVVSGRGLLHLGVLLETMRREGYELCVGKPHVVLKEIDGVICEPIEELVVDSPQDVVGAVMELVGARKGTVVTVEPRGSTSTHMRFHISSRGLIGLRSRVMTATQGQAIMHHAFERYEPWEGEIGGRPVGVMISTETGRATAYSIEQFAERGVMFISPGDEVYTGQVVGEHNRDNDIVINITRAKQMTNFRESNKEATTKLKTPRQMGLEQYLEYVEEDELVEITPESVRLRKRLLDENARKRAERSQRDKASAMA
ncbi:MAG: translational GTPase TypA [Phycisphaerales bacterium]